MRLESNEWVAWVCFSPFSQSIFYRLEHFCMHSSTVTVQYCLYISCFNQSHLVEWWTDWKTDYYVDWLISTGWLFVHLLFLSLDDIFACLESFLNFATFENRCSESLIHSSTCADCVAYVTVPLCLVLCCRISIILHIEIVFNVFIFLDSRDSRYLPLVSVLKCM